MTRWLIALLPSVAIAQPYIEFGVGAAIGGCVFHAEETRLSVVDRSRVRIEPGCSPNPLGIVAIGYQLSKEWRLHLEHVSSLPDSRDSGVDILSIRYRYTFD